MNAPPRNRSVAKDVAGSPSPALRERFLLHRAQDIATAHEALDREDFTWLETLGHNLMGSGSSFGFPDMSAVARDVEAAAQSRDAGAVREALARLASAVAEARRTPCPTKVPT